MIKVKRNARFVTFALALLSPISPTLAEEIAPGRITNPGGLQRFQGAAYNSMDDEYLLIYQGDGFPRVRRLSVTGTFLADVVLIDGAIGVSNVGIVYNPSANEYLALYRSDTTIYGRHLDRNGQPIGGRFVVGTGGAFGRADYSVTSDRYLVVWREGPSPIQVKYAFIDGDSSSADPVIERNALANGDNAHTAWGSANDKFLVVYTRSVGTLAEEAFGKIVEGDGSDRSDEFLINGGPRAQTNPQVGYASSHDVFMVSAEDWRKKECCRADVNGQMVDSNGNLVGARFPIVNTANGGWDVPGPIGYSDVTGQLLSTSYIEPTGVAREINPGDGSRGEKIVLGNELTVPIAIATRSRPDDPQALILSRANLGGDGVHAHILTLEIPPPSIAPTTWPDGEVGTFYSEAISVVGGTPPFTFALVSGNMPPGMGGNANTGVMFGTPTTAGVFGFRVRVTDDDGRMTEADMTFTVGLPAPVLQSPIDTATTDQTPTFDWDATPGATSYDLIVENITNGGTPINENINPATSFTPGSNLPAGKLYRWRVKAMGGGLDGPFSDWAHFEIDNQLPPAIQLSGAVPEPNSPINGLTASDVSTQHKNAKSKEKAVDGKNKTSWMSVGSNSQQDEHITVDLGAAFDVSQISVRSKRGARFPVDFELQISNSPTSGFVTLASFSAFDAGGNTWYDFPVAATNGRYLKILVTKKGFHKGKFWAEISEIDVFQRIDHMGSIIYTFKAPTDDAGSGNESVVGYDLRYMMGDAATFDWGTATPFVGEPTPGVFGSDESILVQGLNDETTYAAAITSTDDAGNVSLMSNIDVVRTASIPPGAITDLQVVDAEATGTSIRLRWTAPPDNAGDNGSGPVDHYDIRCSTSPIASLAAFKTLPMIAGPDPAAPGSTEEFDVPNLNNQTNYFCGVLAVDHTAVESGLGSTDSGSTLDVIPPDPVGNLNVNLSIGSLPPSSVDASSELNEIFVKENAVDGDPDTRWSTPGREVVTTEFIKLDFGTSVAMNLVRLQAPNGNSIRFPRDFTIQVSDDDIGYTIVHTENDFAATDGTWYEFPFTATSARYVKIEVTEQNLSSGKYFTQIAEIEVLDPSGPLVQAVVTWFGSGDDGNNGTATSYEVRHDTAAITAANFNLATLSPGAPPAPSPPGTKETFVIGSGLTPGVTTWFAVETTDDQGNTSLAAVSKVTPSP